MKAAFAGFGDDQMALKLPEGLVNVRAFSPYPGAAKAAVNYLHDLQESHQALLELLDETTTKLSSEQIHPRTRAALLSKLVKARSEWITKYGS